MSSSDSDPHASNDSSDSTELGDDPTTGVAGENTPDKLTKEEIEILQANLVEWKASKGDKQKPVQRRVRGLIQQLSSNEYIIGDDWKLKLKVSHILCMSVTAKIGLAY